MAATARQDREMRMKYEKQKKTAQNPLDLLRAYVLAQGVRGIKSLARCFKRIDKNDDKKLNFEEFQQALHNDGIYVEKETERECFDSIDTDHSGELSFDEFLVALRPPMSQCRRKLIGMAFQKLDKNGDGVVTVEDLKGVYSGKKHPKYLSGEMTEEQILQEWLNSFNGPDHNDGIVTQEDFENYYCGVSASVDSDVYFDLMMRQAWKL